MITKPNVGNNEALSRPDVIAKFNEMAAFPRPGTAADLDRLIVSEQKSLGRGDHTPGYHARVAERKNGNNSILHARPYKG